ncbi:unnamed protein product [Gadus morhua 'NCC']
MAIQDSSNLLRKRRWPECIPQSCEQPRVGWLCLCTHTMASIRHRTPNLPVWGPLLVDWTSRPTPHHLDLQTYTPSSGPPDHHLDLQT